MAKRKDKNRIPPNSEESQPPEKSVLLLVEGETEQVYFDKLKQNPWLKNALSGVNIRIGKETDIEKSKKEYNKIWFVSDNDKRNAFVLAEKGAPFWKQNCALPNEIIDILNSAYIDDEHRYFLSIYDYLQWLKTAIGADNVVQYWDMIQHFTPIKNREWQQFDNKHLKNTQDKKVQLAYSCIAFEFWLLSHFEQNSTPFLWVEKEKSKDIDVFEYFINHHRRYYKKGGEEKPCNAYTCLYDDYTKTRQTQDDDWVVIYRIATACQNAKWLQNKMQPILQQQNGNWYEVNPYIKGLDVLMADLVNLKYCNERIEYQDTEIQFRFDRQKQHLFITVLSTQDSFSMQDQDLKIKNKDKTFLPEKAKFNFPNNAKEVCFEYTDVPKDNELLILLFKPTNFQKQLLVILK